MSASIQTQTILLAAPAGSAQTQAGEEVSCADNGNRHGISMVRKGKRKTILDGGGPVQLKPGPSDPNAMDIPAPRALREIEAEIRVVDAHAHWVAGSNKADQPDYYADFVGEIRRMLLTQHRHASKKK